MTDRRVFVNYRQRDGKGELRPHALIAEALANRLQHYFGEESVYFDTTLRPGAKYAGVLRDRLADSAVVVVIIHREWLADLGERVGSHKDWVHWEIAEALAADKTLIPVLLPGAELPRFGDLPADIRGLSAAQAVTIPFGGLETAYHRVFAEIQKVVAPAEDVPRPEVKPIPQRAGLLALGLSTLVPVLLQLGLALSEYFPAPTATFWMIALAIALLMPLVLLLLISATIYALRHAVNWIDREMAQLTDDRPFFVFGAGVAIFSGTAVIVLIVTGENVALELRMVVFAVFMFVLLGMAVQWLKNRGGKTWPPRLVDARPGAVMSALAVLAKKLEQWGAPLPMADHRDARLAIDQVSCAARTLAEHAERGRLAWWRATSTRVRMAHTALAGAVIGAATAAVVTHWAAVGFVLVDVLWWAATLAATAVIYAATLEFHYRAERSRIATVLADIPAAIEVQRKRLAYLVDPLAARLG
ncbi:toll/interleukin-1 receptor domain-containing protein [Actinokineospora cianjurensis]|uniref:TIR domain-containing protein n=1 Tax=Actinokineospora cianjurensis TaxID=585224 RepID=A0A421AWQ8_9PSEU|nr:toll/interleukin-1 receptor domain-containing protein [Actinokineospora cianjurensis]RLK54194.1 TIR domain-containing protein [Actinokineospora cianjurensis]